MFKRIISLGWFCSIALEIKRIGLRVSSYPFDWLMTHSFSSIINLIAKNDIYYVNNDDDDFVSRDFLNKFSYLQSFLLKNVLKSKKCLVNNYLKKGKTNE